MNNHEATDLVWIWKFNSAFMTLNNTQYQHTKNHLEKPSFAIGRTQTTWGTWSPSKRRIMINERLIRNFEWAAVKYVLAHEMAHQIVSEIFDIHHVKSHGEAFERACKLLDIECHNSDSSDYLSKFAGLDGESPIVRKVRKLLALGADGSGASQAEGESALKKAQEVMLRHNVKMTQVTGSERVFISRPFGKNYKRFPTWLWSLTSLLRDHYDISVIQTWYGVGEKRIELFGEPEKLDIAEYVGYAIMNQGAQLWKSYKIEQTKIRAQRKARGEYVHGRVSERAFMEGLITGYSGTLDENRDIVSSKIEAEDGVLIPYDSGLLDHNYRNYYPNLRKGSRYAGSRGIGGDAGRSAGAGLRIGAGISSTGNKGRLLA